MLANNGDIFSYETRLMSFIFYCCYKWHLLIYASTNILERTINYVPLMKPSFDNTSIYHSPWC
jgi:hypothetical protein